MDSEFTGKRVLVTGGARGLGKAIVQKFYENGAIVFVFDKEELALQELKTEFPGVSVHIVDLLDWEKTKNIIQSISPLHHLVNNAGVMQPALLMEMSMENLDLTLGVNVKAVVNVTQGFVRGNGDLGGTIVNISSYADSQVLRGGSSYNCSKAAVTMLTKNMALELGPKFRVNCVRPAGMVTDMMINVAKDYPEIMNAAKHLRDRCIIKERVEVADCAELVIFLSSSKSSKITGQGIAIDGGMSIG